MGKPPNNGLNGNGKAERKRFSVFMQAAVLFGR